MSFFTTAREQIGGFSRIAGALSQSTQVGEGRFLTWDSEGHDYGTGSDAEVHILMRHNPDALDDPYDPSTSEVKMKYMDATDVCRLFALISRTEQEQVGHNHGFLCEVPGWTDITPTDWRWLWVGPPDITWQPYPFYRWGQCDTVTLVSSNPFKIDFANLPYEGGVAPVIPSDTSDWVCGTGGPNPGGYPGGLKWHHYTQVQEAIKAGCDLEFVTDYWEKGGDETACYGYSIGDSSLYEAIDLDGHALGPAGTSWTVNGYVSFDTGEGITVNSTKCVGDQQAAPADAVTDYGSPSNSLAGSDEVDPTALANALNALGVVFNAIITQNKAYGAFAT